MSVRKVHEVWEPGSYSFPKISPHGLLRNLDWRKDSAGNIVPSSGSPSSSTNTNRNRAAPKQSISLTRQSINSSRFSGCKTELSTGVATTPDIISKPELVDRLTSPDTDMEQFRRLFLFNFYLFMTSEELLKELSTIFTNSEGRQREVALCVFAEWIENDGDCNWKDFWEAASTKEGAEYLQKLTTKDENETSKDIMILHQRIRKFLKLNAKNPKSGVIIRSSALSFSQRYSLGEALNKSDDTKSNKNLWDLPVLELSNYFNIVDSLAFIEIGRREWQDKAWTRKETRETKSPNIYAMVRIFNERSDWASAVVLAIDNVDKRAEVLKQIIDVAHKCSKINNFFGAISLYNGISISPILRLRKTWNKIGSKTLRHFKKLVEDYDHKDNFLAYRERYATAIKGLSTYTPPKSPKRYATLGKSKHMLKDLCNILIPNLVVLLKDLFALEEVSLCDKGKDRLAFYKLRLQWRELKPVWDCQRLLKQAIKAYHITPDPKIENMKNKYKIMNEEELWERSYQLEAVKEHRSPSRRRKKSAPK